MLRAVASGIGLLLLLIGSATRAEGGTNRSFLRIDLSDEDPIGIEDLPGILDEEIEALRSVAGPGARDLAESLSRTGIPPARLREWVPYIDLPLAGPGRSGWATRAGLVAGGGSDLRERINLRLAHPSTGGELTARIVEDPDRPGGAERVSMDGRACARLGPTAILRGGCIEGSTGSIDPWRDPLRDGRALSASSPRAGAVARAGSRGLCLERGGLALSAWRDDGPSCGGLIARRSAKGASWLGWREGEGSGGGHAVRIRTAFLTTALHRPVGVPPVIRVGASDDAQRIRLATAWSLGERGDGRTAVADGSLARMAGAFRLSLRGTLLGRTRPEPTQGRGGIGVSWGRGSTSGICEATWSGTRRNLRAELDRDVRPGLRLLVKARARLARSSPEGSLDLSASALGRRFRCSVGCVYRTAELLRFPSYPGAAGATRIALHARGSMRSRFSRVDFVLAAPFSAGERVRFAEPFASITIVQSASPSP